VGIKMAEKQKKFSKETEDIVDKFWEEWFNSVNRREKLKQLAFKNIVRTIEESTEDKELSKALVYSFYSVLNSYFEDLAGWCFSKKKEEKK